MKQKVSKIKEWRPGREALFLLYFPAYLLLFFAAEHLITGNYWVSWCALDDVIPFVKEFVYAYILWFPYMVGATLWLVVRDKRAFVRYAVFAMISMTACYVIYFLFPSGQELRPDAVEGGSLAAFILRAIYAADTNTNVFPSMHVVGTLVAMAGLWDTDSVSRRAKLWLLIVGVFIIVSTVFVKQHSALDVFSGIALCAVVYPLVYKLIRK